MGPSLNRERYENRRERNFEKLEGLYGPASHSVIERWQIEDGILEFMMMECNARVHIMASYFYSDGHSLGKSQGT